MISLETDGLAQWTMANLCQVSVPTVNKFINTHNFKPLDSSIHRNQKFSIQVARKIISEIREINKYSILKKKFAFYNFKGGTGKTSLCFQVASHIAIMGYKVLVIDADPQAHLSASYGLVDEQGCTLYDLLINKVNFSQIKKSVFEGLDCIPANISLTRIEVGLNDIPRREERILMDLGNIEKDYDFIFIDTNPTISLLNRNIITFCDVVNIVCETQPYSLNGLKLLTEDLEKFYANMGITPRDLNIIPNKYEDRASSSAECMTALKKYYNDYVIPDYAVRRSEDINSSAKLGKPLAVFAKKNSIALADVVELLYYLLNKYTKNNINVKKN